MAKQNFTPNGVAAKLSELNGLSAQALNIEMASMQSDLKSWVSANFNLDQTQQTFLGNIDSNFIAYASYITPFAILHGRSVILTVSGDGPLKLISVRADIVCSYSTNGFTVTGDVYYDVTYS